MAGGAPRLQGVATSVEGRPVPGGPRASPGPRPHQASPGPRQGQGAHRLAQLVKADMH